MVIEISNQPKKWVRSSTGPVAGVFEGLGRSFDVDPNVLRLGWVLSVLLFGTGLILYPLFALVLPREDELYNYDKKKFLGVCRMISHNYGVELGIVRLVTVVSAFASLGLTFVLYVGLFFFLPENKEKLYF
ncbi:MAG: PspC domain-containing protein [Halobacteriovoraceae bacterium]|jgi:phage shock protein C|nr:PspC domain-containing protein [Halobacteriovoraceae bacterium]